MGNHAILKLAFGAQAPQAAAAAKPVAPEEGSKPLLNILSSLLGDATEPYKNIDQTTLQSAIDTFVDSGSTLRWWRGDAEAGRQSLSAIEHNLKYLVNGASRSSAEFKMPNTNEVLSGTQAMVVVLDILQKGKSQIDPADLRNEGIDALQKGLHDKLAKMECPKPVGERKVSASWLAKQGCPAP